MEKVIGETFEVTIFRCARCGQSHKMKFNKFAINPIEESDGTVWNYWGLCPITGEPVLNRIVQTSSN